MISNACATMRTARSFLPLLRPFIIMLLSQWHAARTVSTSPYRKQIVSAPVNQPLDNGHLSLLELLLGVTAGSVWKVDGMADLDVVGEGDVLDLNTRYHEPSEGCPRP